MSEVLTDYFALMGISPGFDIDYAILEKQYFALQRQLHPDRFMGKIPQERTQSLQLSMTANEAYNTLKDPFKRGEYLLARQGIFVKEGTDSIKPSQEVLILMMELREQLEDVRSLEEVEKMSAYVEQEKHKVLRLISTYFGISDYEHAAQEVIRLRYLDKTQEEIKIKRKGIKAA